MHLAPNSIFNEEPLLFRQWCFNQGLNIFPITNKKYISKIHKWYLNQQKLVSFPSMNSAAVFKSALFSNKIGLIGFKSGALQNPQGPDRKHQIQWWAVEWSLILL